MFLAIEISSLYVNINHQACFKNLEERENKPILYIFIKKISSDPYIKGFLTYQWILNRQLNGTAIGTPIALNYDNLFMDSFKQTLLKDYFQTTGLLPLVWFCFIEDIFFLWIGNMDSPDHFISFT